MDVFLRYVGTGSLADVPARDLTKEEAERFGVDRLVGSGLYVPVQAKSRVPEAENKLKLPKSGSVPAPRGAGTGDAASKAARGGGE